MMKTILLLYLKTFSYFAIAFGILTLALDLIFDHEFSWRFLRTGFNSGLFMSLFFVTIHIISVRISGEKKFTSENLAVEHKHSIISGISQEDLISKLKTNPSFEEMKITIEKGEIIIKTGLTFNSWGETISIHVKPVTSISNEFEIISKPKQRWTLVDFGKNLNNVKKVEELMAKPS